MIRVLWCEAGDDVWLPVAQRLAEERGWQPVCWTGTSAVDPDAARARILAAFPDFAPTPTEKDGNGDSRG